MLKRFLARAHAADVRTFARVARSDVPALDATLPRLSHAADHGKLWFAVAAVLAATGGRHGKRAAMRGLLGVGIASAFANVSVKLAVRRARPDIGAVPLRRLLRRTPLSSSFPSGHSASAAAFATGVALEHPLAGAATGVLAGAVGLSRVYTGVHYPSDVLAGFAIGVGGALATTRFFPRVPRAPEPMALTLVDVERDGANVGIVINGGARTTDDDLAGSLGDEMPDADIITTDGDGLAGAARALARRTSILGVAGGDGSINTAAAIALEHDRPLLIVPGGTLNHLARDLGIDSVEHSLAALRDGCAARVDVATIDGKPFLNTASFGPYPELVDEREKREGLIGKWPAFAVAMWKVLRSVEPVPIELDGRPRRIWMIFIGNCHYEPSGFFPARRTRLDDGMLDVRIVSADRRFARARLLASLLTGSLHRSRVYEEHAVRALHVRSLDGPMRLSRDGEVFDGSREFRVEKSTEPLRVLVPGDQSRANARPTTNSTASKAAIPSPVSHGPAAL